MPYTKLKVVWQTSSPQWAVLAYFACGFSQLDKTRLSTCRCSK